MKRRIVSKYPHPTKYKGGLLRLSPGVTLVEGDLWTKAKQVSSRLLAQLADGLVEDTGWYVTWFVNQTKTTQPVEAKDVNALSPEEAQEVVLRISDKDCLSDLLSKAERGGIKGVFRSALVSGRDNT